MTYGYQSAARKAWPTLIGGGILGGVAKPDRSGPSGADDRLIREAPAATATAAVRVHREVAGWRDKVRTYDVMVDQRKVGEVPNGGVFESRVTPGDHTPRIKIDWTGSATLTFTVNEAERAEFTWRARPSGTGISNLVRSIWRRDEWVKLERIR